jgi:hypothetical protein
MTRHLRSSIATAVSLTAVLLVPTRSMVVDPQKQSGTTPSLVVSIQGLSANALGGGNVTASWPFSPANHPATIVVAGGSREFADLCAVSGGGRTFEAGTRVGWKVEGRLLSADADGARIWIRWTRSVLDPSIADARDLTREFETRLTEGTRHVIDLVRPPEGSNPTCDGAVVQIGLELSDSKDLKEHVLDYDVWLVHRDADGREVLDRTTARGLQGKRIEYLFKPLRYRTDGSRDPSGEVELAMQGSVKGRVRPDGMIDLSVATNRTTTKGGLGQGDGGSKQATVRDGETLEFEMPPHRFRGPGFDGQHTAIRVTVRRLS